jgi:hypothetical protein
MLFPSVSRDVRPPWPAAAALLGLASLLFAQAACAAADSPTGDGDGRALAAGVWGGRHLRMDVIASGAELEYDCAHGAITEELKLDDEGRFQAKGTHSREHGGPTRSDEVPSSRPATYRGRVSRKTMTLTVTLGDPAEELGTFTLTQGSEGDVVKCR